MTGFCGRASGLALAAGAMLALGASLGGARAADCGDMDNQNEMNICADNVYRAADAELNRAYRQYAAKLEAHDRALLADAERAWIAFRDKECIAATAENEGGSIHPFVYAGCLTRLTKARTRDLKAKLACLTDAESC